MVTLMGGSNKIDDHIYVKGDQDEIAKAEANKWALAEDTMNNVKSRMGREPQLVADEADTTVVVLHTFMILGTIAECAFDLVQGMIFLRGFEYDSEAQGMIVIGTWCGVGDEVIDFVMDTIGMVHTEFKANTIFLYCGTMVFFVVFEQCLAIYAAVHGLRGKGGFTWIPVVAAAIVLMLAMALCVYLIWKWNSDKEFRNGSRLPFLNNAIIVEGTQINICDGTREVNVNLYHDSEFSSGSEVDHVLNASISAPGT